MKESGLETASSRNIWGVLTLISTIVAIILIIFILLLDIVVPQDHPCYALHRMLCDFCDDFFEIIVISLLFLFIASFFFGVIALDCRSGENEAKKRDEKLKKQKAEAKKLQAKLDKMIKERSSDKT